MKNAMSKNHDSVLAYIKANQNLNFDSIKEGNPKISYVLLKKIIKELQEDGIIAANNEDGGYVFTGTSTKKEAQTGADAKETKPKEIKSVGAKVADTKEKKKDEDDLGPATPSGRDYSKYDFNGQKGLTKGKLALAIVKKYVEDNPKATLAKMEEVFESKTIQPRYGVLEELTKAKKHTKNNRERYFLKPEEIIKITPKAAVTNQWSGDTLKPLLVIAKKLGYKINVSK